MENKKLVPRQNVGGQRKCSAKAWTRNTWPIGPKNGETIFYTHVTFSQFPMRYQKVVKLPKIRSSADG